jgi:protein-disulfide isomerase
MSPRVSRRAALAVVAGAAFDARGARAEIARAVPLSTPEGAVIRNFAIAPALAPSDLPGLIRAGAAKGAPVLYEFYDYACPYCRLASQEVDLLLGPDSGMTIGLAQHPVLGERSVETALVVLAARSLSGDDEAFRLHSRLFATPGPVGADWALKIAETLGFDRARLKARAARPETRATLEAHIHRALALGLRQTPSFVLGGYAFIGWPGPETVQSFVEALARCGGLACTDAAK